MTLDDIPANVSLVSGKANLIQARALPRPAAPCRALPQSLGSIVLRLLYHTCREHTSFFLDYLHPYCRTLVLTRTLSDPWLSLCVRGGCRSRPQATEGSNKGPLGNHFRPLTHAIEPSYFCSAHRRSICARTGMHSAQCG